MKSIKSRQSNFIEQPPRRRICTSWIVPLLLLWMLPLFGVQSAVVFSGLYSFTGGNDGANPYAGLVQGSDDNFYGTTAVGGTNGWGTVFRISTNGALTSLYSFIGTNDGAIPTAGLVQGNDGCFYGTTRGSFYPFPFSDGYGSVFKISTNGALTSLHLFTGGSDGANPETGVVQGSDGNFYGTTFGGGTVFRISTNGALTTLGSLTGGPYGPVQGSDGDFYGTTFDGGMNGDGSVFKVSTNGGGQVCIHSPTAMMVDAPCRAGAGQRPQSLWHDSIRQHLRLRHRVPNQH